MIKKLAAGLMLGLTIMSLNPIEASAEWKQNNDNKWTYEENGQAASGWKFIDGNWYNFSNGGIMQTGWIPGENKDWYYCWSNGTMASNSWLTNGGLWYYFDAQGKLVTDKAVIGENTYYFNAPAIIISTQWGKDYDDSVIPTESIDIAENEEEKEPVADEKEVTSDDTQDEEKAADTAAESAEETEK